MNTLPSMLVTGASDGIGFQTALQLALNGAQVLAHARSEAKALDATRRLVDEGAKAERLVPVWGDLGDLAQVRALAARVRQVAPKLDVLVNNAGVFMNSNERTAEGFEVTVGVNHLAPVLLTHELMPALEASGAGRVVNVSSIAHTRGRVHLDDVPVPKRFEGYSAYAASKLMNVLFTHELARRLEGRPVSVFALHPGVISTKLLKSGFGMGGADVTTGARTSVHCATTPGLAVKSGAYFSDAREVPCAPHANDPSLERALYLKSCQLVGCAPLG
ncbi:MAG: SDR family NAD(P)-dependent oxidoreductase [Myxococcaceae bacterium]|nr:SDR family NAD(P)-dependent oxidoreductase [Myxococcaceae bacterium]